VVAAWPSARRTWWTRCFRRFRYARGSWVCTVCATWWDGGFAYMQLDKNIERQVRAALGSAGFDVETLIED
jgi:hypothetical protein